MSRPPTKRRCRRSPRACPTLRRRDAQAFFTRLKKEKTCYLLHLSEGADATRGGRFSRCSSRRDEWAITPSLCGIHAAALQAQDFEIARGKGGSMVWSPFSNMLLYGGTADVAAAKAAGVPISLGPRLGTLGQPQPAQRAEGGSSVERNDRRHLSARELVAMVTREAARTARMGSRARIAGSGQACRPHRGCGHAAGDPYLQLIGAKGVDLALVMINGVARFGAVALMQAVGPAGESIKIGGHARTLYLAHPNADPLVQGLTLANARDELKAALRTLPTLARRAERPGKPQSAAARAANAGNTWRLALDEIIDSGVDLRPQLPARDEQGRPLRVAMMRPFAAMQGRLSAAVEPMTIDALTVVDDDGYLDAVNLQRNLPEPVKQGIVALWA